MLAQGYFKLHPTGRYVHSVIDALEDLLSRSGKIDLARIERIEVKAYRLAAMLKEKRVTSSFGARFSVPFALATILHHGRSELAAFEQPAVDNPAIQALAARVEVREEPSYTARYPAEQPCDVRIVLSGGQALEGRCTITKGEPSKPHRPEELQAKFMQLGAPLWGEPVARRLLEGCLKLEDAAGFFPLCPGVRPMKLKTHGRYDYSAHPDRKDYSWPGGKRLAVHLCLNVEHFSFGEGLGNDYAAPHPQPNTRSFAWRDYGNRVGAWRLLELAEAYDLPYGLLVNTALYDYCPQMVAAFSKRGDEIVGHGRTNAERQADMPLEPKSALHPGGGRRDREARGQAAAGLARALHLADARLARSAARGRLPLHDGLAARRPAGLVPHQARPHPLDPLRARPQRFARVPCRGARPRRSIART